VYVPKAGVVFVEGAVRKPDVYPLQGDVTVLKAITMAGGLAFKARKSGIQLIRLGEGEPEVLRLDLAAITRSPASDVHLRDGDIVVVGSNPIKVGLDGIWRGFSGLVRVSAGL
jgi:polysaccharide export outer membrane protein